jgi:hypothetical protein
MKSKEYNKFSIYEGNIRPYSHEFAKKLAKSMEQIGYDISKPITVNRRLEILDGRHRFEAAKMLNISFYYEVTMADEDIVIRDFNELQRIWKLETYIDYHANMNKPKYKELKWFKDNSNLPPSVSLLIYVKSGSNNRISSTIRKGLNFKINNRYMDIYKFIIEAKKKVPYAYTKNFVISIVTVHNSLEDKYIKKIFGFIDTIKQQVSVKDYINIYTNKLNVGRKNGEPITIY